MVRKIFFLAATTAFVSANAQNFNVDGYEAVDLGLSVLWATCNVGADSPEEVGDYFAWGEVDAKEKFYNDDYFFGYGHEDNWDYREYNQRDGKTVLESKHDAATKNWSNNWRMPTKEEFEELFDKCEYIKKENGFEFKNETTNNSIFLPNNLRKVNQYEYIDGGYWTNSINIDDLTSAYCFDSNGLNDNSRYTGLVIRAVCEKSAITKLNYVEKENANTVYKTFENGQIVIVKNGVKYNLVGKRL